MLTLLKAIILLPVALVVILLAIANRAPVTFSLDPFARSAPELAFAVPLYLLLFATMVLGVLLGGIGAWLTGSRHRRSNRAARREVGRLRQETDRLRTNLVDTRTTALPPPRRVA